VPSRTTARTVLPPALVVLVAACALLTTAVALAGPAAAIEDPRRPVAEVTHGPSCGPGVVRVLVTNGTVPHRLALVFDGESEQDDAELADAEQAELTSEDVDWGQTVDVSVTVTAEDGTVEDPLELGTYTRPSAEDCAAVTSPPTDEPEPAPSSPGTTTPSAPSSTSAAPTSAAPTPPTPPWATTPRQTPRPTTTPRPSSPRPTGQAPVPDDPRSSPPASTASSSSSSSAGGGQGGSASAASVSPGGVVTLRATGFTPGEAVTVSLLGVDGPLSTVTAAGDGSVEAVVQIPRGAALGTATVQLVGASSSAVAGLDLQVAARSVPVTEQATSVPVLAAGIALIGASAALGLLAARRSRGHQPPAA
jgi:hypothetical protein